MVRIPIGNSRPLRVLRALVGSIFLVIAAAFLTSALRGHSEDWPWGLLCLLGALLNFAFRNYLEIDEAARLLSRRTGLVYGFRIRSFDIDAVKRIVLVTEWRKSYSRSRGSTGSRTKVYVLRINGPADGQLCELQEMWPARLLAERVCRALRVDLENRLLDGNSLRPAAELDLPLAERWRRAGEHKEAPRLPAETQLTLEMGDDFSELSAPVTPIQRRWPVLIMAVLLGGAYVLIRLQPELVAVVGLFAVGGICLCAALIAQHTGRNRIRFTADRIEIRRGSLHRQSMALADIEEILSNDEQFVLMGDQQYVYIDKMGSPADQNLQRQFIERQIAQRHIGS